MMPGRLGVSLSQENKLWISWHDTTWIPILNPSNIMEYFSQKSNPFYDRTCNNENIRMQRLALDQLTNLVGVEYILLHVAEPILYVVRKQHRHSPSEATPLADYYIIAGIVYQAPDLANVFNSRILSAVTNLESAFEEASSFSRYHANKGYTWDFVSNKSLSDKLKAVSNKDMPSNKEESASIFQCQRVDMLLVDLLSKFPPRIPLHLTQQATAQSSLASRVELTPDQGTVKHELVESVTSNNNTSATSPSSNFPGDIKVESNEMKPPPDKKFKM